MGRHDVEAAVLANPDLRAGTLLWQGHVVDESIAAEAEGEPCVTHIGTDGA